jgi:GTP-binding protein
MVSSVVSAPRFLTSAASSTQFPPDLGLEVAVAGRSNSGKSSALNAIAGRRALARTSRTPGRTRMINFFELAPDRRLVDLPGYGFARVSASARRSWEGLVRAYFHQRSSITALLVTADIRRDLDELDLAIVRWGNHLGVPIAVLLTKADKLSRQKRLLRRAAVGAMVQGRAETVIFSAPHGHGVPEVRARLGQWLEIEWRGHKEAPGAGFRGHTRGEVSRSR